VIQVYEVGEHDEQVFVAMELVRGHSLGEVESPPGGALGWHEIVDVFIQAGRGLSAAHEAGLIHRDFKPDNALLGDDGRVRVLDFGLARRVDDDRMPSIPALSRDVERSSEGDYSVTNVGTIVGTPAYMSPEQWEAKPLTPKTDQFSFCVALWEKLHGERPFDGDSVHSLAASITRGELRRPARQTIPKWLRRALERGLSPNPDLRYPSMPELLDAISPGRRRRRNRMIGGSLVGSLAIVGAVAMGAQTAPDPCASVDQGMDPVWNDEAGARIAAGFRDSTAADAESRIVAIHARFDEYATQWRATRTRACTESLARGPDGADHYARQLMCLGRRLDEMRHLVATFETADRQVVENSVFAVDGLTPLAECENQQRLAAVHAQGADPQRLAELDRMIDRAEARYSLAKHAGARELARAAAEEAQALGDARRGARAALVRSKASARLTELEPAARELARALELCRLIDDRRSLIETLIWKVEFHKFSGDVEGARAAVSEAERLLADSNAPLQAAHLAQARGSMEKRLGNYEPAIAWAEAALTTREEELGPHDIAVGISHNNLGTALVGAGRYEEAVPHLDQGLEIFENVLGANHPRVAIGLGNQGAVLMQLGRVSGDYAEGARRAEPKLARALQIRTERNGVGHPSTARVLHNLAEAKRAKGDLAGAMPLFVDAVAMRDEKGPSKTLATTLVGLGQTRLALGEHAVAIDVLERARTMQTEVTGVSAEDKAESAFALARALQLRGGDGDTVRAIALATTAATDYGAAGAPYRHEREAVRRWLDARTPNDANGPGSSPP
jgi:tetratricopeptide (TPR) repeat protein